MATESFTKSELTTIEMSLLTRRDFLKDHIGIVPAAEAKLERVETLLDKVRKVAAETPTVIEKAELMYVTLVLEGPHPEWRVTHVDGKKVEKRE